MPTMREDTLRSVLLIEAIEESDRAGAIIPPADRAQATRDSQRVLGTAPDQERQDASDADLARALADRAERLVPPLVSRFPVMAEVLGRTRTPYWVLAALLVVAFVSGIALSALDGTRRINVLAFPFLGLVAWNLITYIALAITWIRSGSGLARPSRRSWRWAQGVFRRRIASLVTTTSRVHTVLGQAIARYAERWVDVGAAFIAQRARCWLHLAAAAVAVGLIVGLYLRGTVLRYEAGWESTFLGPGQVKTILGVLYGPAAALSGVALPESAEQVAALRWTATGGGGDAAPWIHLIAVTLLGVIVIPRLLLTAFATMRLAWLGRSGAMPEGLRPTAASIFRGSGLTRSGAAVSVTPYAYEPSDAAIHGLERWLASIAPGHGRLERRPALRYGEEDMAAAGFASGAHRTADLHLVLMNLAATPEPENHGVVIAAARDAAHRARPPAAVRVVVDESPYAQRFAADPSLVARVEERRRLWREFVAGFGLEADLVELEK
jgi:cytochrome b subunit of formate dehydrogenase